MPKLQVESPSPPALCSSGTAKAVALANRIDTGLASDSDGFFSPPLSRAEWRCIAAALRSPAVAATPVKRSPYWICCRCDAPLACAACGVEQPDDSEYYEKLVRCVAQASPLQDAYNLATDRIKALENLLEIRGCDDGSKALPVWPETGVLGSPPGGSGADNPTTHLLPSTDREGK